MHFGTFDGTALALLPSGWMYISVYTADTIGLRWTSNADTTDSARVRTSLGDLLSSFPSLQRATTGLKQFHEFLSAAASD